MIRKTTGATHVPTLRSHLKSGHQRLGLAPLALVLLLAGCASMAPHYERPAAPVAATFPGAGADNSTIVTADIEWQSFFGDSQLKQLIALALENNRDLRMAVLNIELARSQYQVRRADQLPTLNLAAAGSRQPGANGSSTSLYTVGLGVTSFELDFFGRVRSLSDAALAQFLATEEARKSVQVSLVASVANIYLAVLADGDLIGLTQQTLGAREESLKLTKLKFDQGVISELDFQQAQSLVEGARVTLAQQQRQRALDLNALSLLVGQPLPGAAPASTLAAVAIPASLPAGLPSNLLVTRPDIRQAEQQLIAANANIGAARAAFFPRISLTGSAGIASSELSSLVKGGAFAWTLAPQLLLPIFDGGRNRANFGVAQTSRDIAVAQYEKSIQIAFREVADALAGQATYSEQLRAQRAQADAEAARFKLSDLRYKNGVASYLDLLDAQRSLFIAQQAIVQTQLAQLQNQVTLYKVLGGGMK